MKNLHNHSFNIFPNSNSSGNSSGCCRLKNKSRKTLDIILTFCSQAAPRPQVRQCWQQPHTESHGCDVPSHLCDCCCHLSINLMHSRSQQHLCYRHFCGNGSGNVWKHTHRLKHKILYFHECNMNDCSFNVHPKRNRLYLH
jgi:hypothetical protein